MIKKKNLKKRVTGIVAVMVIVAMFLGGTFAYVLNNQHRTDYVHVEDRIFDLTLINNFTAYDKDAWAKDEQVANPILVKSAANTELETYVPAYVALQLMEYIDVYTRGDWLTVGDVESTADAAQALFAIDENGEYMTFDEAELVYGADKLTSYTQDGRTYAMINNSQTKADANARLGIHGKPLRGEKMSFTYGSKDAYDYILANGATQVATDECDADPIEGWSDSDARDYVSFELDADAVLLEDWLEAYALDPDDPALTGAFWILGDNGWAYWAQPLTQGTQTSELLHNLMLEKDVTAIDYYMHVDMAAASRDQIDVLAESKADGGCEMPAELIGMFKALAPVDDDPEPIIPFLMARLGSVGEATDSFWPANGTNSGSVTKGEIKTATFLDYIPADLEQDAAVAHHWDISAAGDGTVMAWLKVNAADSAMYDLYAGGDGGGIVANPDSSYLFSSFNMLEMISLSALDTANVTNMKAMFYNCSLTSLDLSSFDTSKVTTMESLFNSCSYLLDLNLSGFNTANVTKMNAMFYNCTMLINLNLSNFNTSKVTSMESTFSNCKALTNLDLSGFDTSNVTTMYCMFLSCFSLTRLDLSSFNTSSVTTMQAMFSGCSDLASLDVSGFDTSNVTNMQSMFYGCSSLTSLDVRGFDTSNVTTMYQMFRVCTSLTSLDVSGFNTANVTSMYQMFLNCSSLTSLDVSNFNTASVTDMQNMFQSCSSLISLDISGFNTSNVTNMSQMFYSCSSLTSLDVSSFNTAKVETIYGMFQNTTVLKQLDMRNAEFQSGLDTTNMFSGSGLISAGGVMYVKNAAQKAFIDGLSPKPESVIAVS